jgi:probable O-glycosylation ligase (exosortase A-associated)
MPIRDIAILLTVLGSLPFCLFRPWIGVLVWCWLAFMNPHRLTWGFAYAFPFSLLVAVVTLVGFVFTSDRKPLLFHREILVLTGLWLWFGVTTLTAMYPVEAWEKFSEMSRILVMAFLVVPLFQDRRRIRILLLVMGLSLGFYGAKGGLFVLVNGGQYMVLGPPNSFFEANTELALVLNMAIPMLFYLAREEPRPWRRRALWAATGLSILAVPFTYSRGGVIGLGVVLAVLFLKARRRMLIAPALALGLVAFVMFAPQQWTNRMETLQNYEEDQSAQLRLMSWRVALLIAEDRPILGGGFSVFVHRSTYDIYMPEYPRSFGHDAHSIYFNLIGEHGWVGLALFLTLVGLAFMRLYEIRQLARRNPEVSWAANYAHMIQASLATYMVTGASLSVAYFDLAYQFLILVPVIHVVALREIAEKAETAGTVAATMTASPVKAI